MQWIESIFLKRVILAGASALAAFWTAHQMTVLSQLSVFGIDLSVKIDPNKLADALTVALFSLSQGLHEWLAAKYPNVGKYL